MSSFNVQAEDVSSSVREAFNFDVEKYPLSAVMASAVPDHKTGFGAVLSFAQMQPFSTP